MYNSVESFENLPLFLTVNEAGEVLRIGRGKAYELVRCGQLKSIRIGKQIRVPRQAILEFMAVG